MCVLLHVHPLTASSLCGDVWTVERVLAWLRRATVNEQVAVFAGGTVATTTARLSMLHLEKVIT